MDWGNVVLLVFVFFFVLLGSIHIAYGIGKDRIWKEARKLGHASLVQSDFGMSRDYKWNKSISLDGYTESELARRAYELIKSRCKSIENAATIDEITRFGHKTRELLNSRAVTLAALDEIISNGGYLGKSEREASVAFFAELERRYSSEPIKTV